MSHAGGRAAVAQSPQPGQTLELCAVLFLTLGSLVLWVFGWLIGVALLWSSRWWTRGEKVLGTLVVPGGLAGAEHLLLTPPQRCFRRQENEAGEAISSEAACTGWTLPLSLAVPMWVALVVGPIAVPIFLKTKATRRARTAAAL